MNYKFLALFLVIGLNQFWLQAQNIEMIKGSEITSWRQNKSDTIYVINFWATWCKPCIEELPDFEKINQQYKNKKVKVILVSNDFKKQMNTKLIPFIHEKKIASKVVFMDETNPNNWIELVNENWSGAIPATLIIKGSESFSTFHEGKLNYKSLNDIIEKLIP